MSEAGVPLVLFVTDTRYRKARAAAEVTIRRNLKDLRANYLPARQTGRLHTDPCEAGDEWDRRAEPYYVEFAILCREYLLSLFDTCSEILLEAPLPIGMSLKTAESLVTFLGEIVLKKSDRWARLVKFPESVRLDRIVESYLLLDEELAELEERLWVRESASASGGGNHPLTLPISSESSAPALEVDSDSPAASDKDSTNQLSEPGRSAPSSENWHAPRAQPPSVPTGTNAAESVSDSEPWAPNETRPSSEPELAETASLGDEGENRETCEISVVTPEEDDSAKEVSSTSPKRGRASKKDEGLEKLKAQVWKLHREGVRSSKLMCKRLGNHARPPGSRWRLSPWPEAYRNKDTRRLVQRWLSGVLKEFKSRSEEPPV